MAYINQSSSEKIDCIFCAFTKEDNDEKRLILYRGKRAFVMMNAFPYNTGHLMVAHTATAETTMTLMGKSFWR